MAAAFRGQLGENGCCHNLKVVARKNWAVTGLSFGHLVIASVAIILTFAAIQATHSQTASARLIKQVARPFIEARQPTRANHRQRRHRDQMPAEQARPGAAEELPQRPKRRRRTSVHRQVADTMLRLPAELLGSGAESTASTSPRANTTDVNNNNESTATADINNNTISGSSSSSNQVNSVDGTIDLSQYANSDVDRLYGDALLVYMKNFNDTLPVRREMFNISGRPVPAYRSVERRVDEPSSRTTRLR